MIELFTVGFTGKSARRFFELLQQSGVRKIIDTRVSNRSQLAGFAKGIDLEFFAQRIGGIGYAHRPDFAPTRELFDAYRTRKLSWEAYQDAYLDLLDQRKILDAVDVTGLNYACLLCSEPEPDQCHRRLLAEYLQKWEPSISIVHLK